MTTDETEARQKLAAIAIRDALQAGGTLEGIAQYLGKIAILNPTSCLPKVNPIFNAQRGLEMETAYRLGATKIERDFIEIAVGKVDH